MSPFTGNIDGFGLDLRALAGPLDAQLAAVREAGFGQAVLSAHELVAHPQGLGVAIAAVRRSGVRVSALHALNDAEGLSGPVRQLKMDVARSLIETCAAVGARTLVVNASTLRPSSDDIQVVAKDLRRLAMLAVPKGIRVAYRAQPQAAHVHTFVQAWDAVCETDMPNLGVVIDVCQSLAQGLDLSQLDEVDPDKVFLVQLADFLQTPQASTLAGESDAVRAFPGEGASSADLAAWVRKLAHIGYRGPHSLEASLPDYQQMPVAAVAQRALASALWLGEGILQRSVPLPGQMRLRARAPA